MLIDAGPEVRRPGSRRIRDFVNGGAQPEPLDAIIERALTFNPRRDPQVLRRSLMHNLRQQTDGTWTWKYDRRRFQQMGDRASAERRGLAEGLAKVTSPTLVVRGAESDVFHEEDAERLAARLPDGRYVTIPMPATPYRATIRKTSPPRCATFWQRGTQRGRAMTMSCRSIG